MRDTHIYQSPPSTVDEFVEQLECDVIRALESVTPLKSATKRVGQHSWLSDEAKELK